ncbi:MAG TPA: DUF6600 domain-containing protein [Candidatus Sulfotelmatobacter sp.]|nr:DUF6600 domain-containing protein [Candidatus Sulfotelmatobacter sp.]
MKKTGLIHRKKDLHLLAVLVIGISLTAAFSPVARAQDQDQDDPPSRVARLGHIDGSVSFQPAGESEWVEATRNRPMTTGDKLWADRDSRAEVQLGSSKIDLAPNTGFTFLNLDDRTVQIQLSAGTVNVRVYELDRDTDYEIDTANQAFVIQQPGRYRVESSENGDYTIVTIRDGEGESTGNGQSYTIHRGQRVTFRGTTSLNAEVDQIGDPDPFDRWSDDRERRYEDSPSARYCSRQVVGFEDLDEYGEWGPTPEYGSVWYPRVDPGWAPYHYGHWAWIDPWGWTWVDDASWGYAPFHYGRWVFVGSRWGWIPGPREVRPVYAPALVAFVGGLGIGVGGNVAWFPLGPREVYVPSYRVSRAYVNQVNVSNTTVNVTQVTNVYNTTIVNNNTTINNVTYVNRNVRGGVTAVPQQAFATAQPVSRAAVAVNQSQLQRAPVNVRAAVPPARQAVMGTQANNRVAAPPQEVVSRQVIARRAPPPPPPSFAARQQMLAQHPGVPVSRPQLQQMRAANPPASTPRVITAPPARPQPLPAAGNRPGNPPNARPTAPGNPPAANERPGMNNPAANRPQPGNPPPNTRPQPNQPDNRPQPGANRPFEPPTRSDRPAPAQPNNRPDLNQPNNNRPQPNQPQPNRPAPNQPNPGYRPQPNQPAPNQPAPNNRPDNNRGFEPPARNDRPPAAQPNRPESNQPAPNNRPDMNRPSEPPARNDRPPAAQPNRPEPNQPAPNNRPDMNRPSEPPARNDHPSSMPPNNRPQPQPETNRPQPTPPPQNRPEMNRPPQRSEPAPPPRNEPAPRPQAPPPSERQQARPPAENRSAPPPAPREPNKPQPKQDDKHKPPQ